jgi:AcrR family transcriptional regulator
MPKVTEHHKAQRRDQVLTAAWKCFARSGFHGTSMAEIIAESQLSAGAVYLYFRSKEDLIAATASMALGMARDLMNQLGTGQDPAPPDAVLYRLLDLLIALNDDHGGLLFPVAVEAWSEASRNPSIAETAGEFLDTIVDELGRVYGRWADAGHALAIPPKDMARISVAVLQGTIVQLNGFGQSDDPGYRSALTTLFSSASSPADTTALNRRA